VDGVWCLQARPESKNTQQISFVVFILWPNRYYIEILLFIMIKFFFPSRLDFQAFYHCHPPLSTEKCGHERPLIPVGKAAIARVALYPALWPELRLVPSRSASAHTSRPAILHVNHRPHAASWDNSR
jgi:hypothetical protein